MDGGIEEMKKYKRILIFGRAGTGKNWFGEQLSEKLKIKFYDIDDISWKRRFTIRRSLEERTKRLKSIVKKDRWILAGWATSYIGSAKKRADLIIILKANFFVTTYRIVKRQIKHKKLGKEESKHSIFSLIYHNFLTYLFNDELKPRFNELKQEYPEKIKVFSQEEIRKFLKRC
jgi:adenylate kinase family enzyme